MRNGVLGVASSTGSSDWDIIRGVAFNVPQVISCFTAAGPSSAAVGEGRLGTSKKLVGDLGRSEENGYKKNELPKWEHLREVPVIAASIRLLVGLGGEEWLCEVGA